MLSISITSINISKSYNNARNAGNARDAKNARFVKNAKNAVLAKNLEFKSFKNVAIYSLNSSKYPNSLLIALKNLAALWAFSLVCPEFDHLQL